MSKSIAVLGAGPGLGQAVASRYVGDGYKVVLVARRPQPLHEMASELSSRGGNAAVVTADLSNPSDTAALAAQIRAQVGELDAIYYGPTPGRLAQPTPGGPIRPSQLAPQDVEAYMPIALYTLMALVREFLPHMRDQQHGALLVAAGASAVRGVPYFSGPGAALAAQRNYLQSLETELTDTGIFIGRLYIGATIKDSAWHKRTQAHQTSGQPIRTSAPIVDPSTLADILWNMHHTTRQPETLYPTAVFNP